MNRIEPANRRVRTPKLNHGNRIPVMRLQPRHLTIACIAFFISNSARAQDVNERPVTRATKQERRDLYGDPLPTHAICRIGSLQLRCSGELDLQCSGDGKRLVGFSQDRQITIWDSATGKQLRRHSVEGSEPLHPGYVVSRDARCAGRTAAP